MPSDLRPPGSGHPSAALQLRPFGYDPFALGLPPPDFRPPVPAYWPTGPGLPVPAFRLRPSDAGHMAPAFRLRPSAPDHPAPALRPSGPPAAAILLSSGFLAPALRLRPSGSDLPAPDLRSPDTTCRFFDEPPPSAPAFGATSGLPALAIRRWPSGFGLLAWVFWLQPSGSGPWAPDPNEK